MRTNEEIIDILKTEKNAQGLSISELARRVGMAKSAISRYFNGSREFPLNRAKDFANALGISTDYLLGLDTTPTQSTDLPSTVAKLNSGLNQDNHAKWVDYGTALLEEQEETVEEVGLTYDVETVSSLAAGLGFSYDDGDTYTVQVTNEPPRHDIASIVSGDSMLPNYHDGDVVYLVDKGISNYSGQVCAVVVNDKTYLKRVYTEPNALRLVSINPKYSDIVIDFPPSEDTHIKIFSVIGSDRTI